MKKIFALVDANSFFCNCERLFRPELHNRPVIVLSNNDGCAIARTPEAKSLGIKMGAPYFEIKELCEKNGVQVFSSNFSLYTDVSRRLMAFLKTCSDRVEVYSVDEAFLDLSGWKEDEVYSYAKEVRARISREIGIPVSIGIGETKTLSKIANHVAKKSQKANGVVSILNRRLKAVALNRVDVEDIWGIGRKNSVKLRAMGINNAKEFADYRNELRILKLLTKVGLQTKKELQGVHCLELEQVSPKKKEIMSSRSFGQAVYDKYSLKEAIATYISTGAAKMRAQRSLCYRVDVFARTSFFTNREQYAGHGAHKLQSPTLDTGKLITIAWQKLDEFYKGGFEYKKAGIRLSSLVDNGVAQMSFFDDYDSKDREVLMNTMDEINQRFGSYALRSAACGTSDKAWAMLRQQKSPRYTTAWDELPRSV